MRHENMQGSGMSLVEGVGGGISATGPGSGMGDDCGHGIDTGPGGCGHGTYTGPGGCGFGSWGVGVDLTGGAAWLCQE